MGKEEAGVEEGGRGFVVRWEGVVRSAHKGSCVF